MLTMTGRRKGPFAFMGADNLENNQERGWYIVETNDIRRGNNHRSSRSSGRGSEIYERASIVATHITKRKPLSHISTLSR